MDAMRSRDYTPDDARALVAGLRCAPVDNATVGASPSTCAPITVRSRYCCAAASLEDLLARAAADDPRCPCARAHGYALEVVKR